MQSRFVDRLKLLKPIELVVSGYLVYTGILTLVFYNQFQFAYLNLIIRIIIITFMFKLTELKQTNPVEFIRFFFPIVLLGYFYGETDIYNNLFFINYFDSKISSIDSYIFGNQPSLVFSNRFSGKFIAEIMYFGYFSYYLIIIGVPLYFYLKGWKNITEKIIFMMVNSFLLYYIVFIHFPVAGPQYYFNKSELPEIEGFVFAEAMQFIQRIGEKPTGAFPSSHVSICLMMLWITLTYRQKLIFLLAPVSVILLLSTVYIRAHYGIDVIAALVTTPVIYLVSLRMYNRLYNRPIKLSSIWISP